MRLPGRRSPVERLRRKGDVEGLVRLLRERDLIVDSEGRAFDLAAPTRAAAALALGEHEGRRVVHALARALLDQEARVRAAALEAVARHPRPELCATLAWALTGWPAEHEELRERAVEVLVGREEPWLAVFHAEALVDDPRGGELTAIEEGSLRRLAAVPDADDVLEAFARRLVGRLTPPSEQERRRAGSVLAALGPPAVDPLIDALDDPERRTAAAWALGRIRDRRAIGPLTHLLDDPDPALRVVAAVALGRVRHPGAAEALVRASLDERVEVRDAAQAALDEMGSAGLLAGLAAVVGPMAQRLEELERAHRNGESPTLPPTPAPLLRRLLERRSRG